MRIPTILLAAVGIALLSGCATYIPPSGRADLAALSSPSMQESFAAKPAAAFPASIATVRVQAPRYQSYYTQREGLIMSHRFFAGRRRAFLPQKMCDCLRAGDQRRVS